MPVLPTTSHPAQHMFPRDLIAREKLLLQREWLRQVVQVRRVLVAVMFAIGALDLKLDLLRGSGALVMTMAATYSIVNEAVQRVGGRGEPQPWRFWLMQWLDTAIIGLLTASLGTQGYLGLPFLIFAAVAYGLGLPRASRVQLALGCLVYPLARMLGTMSDPTAFSPGRILIETACLAVCGYLAIRGPIRYTYRVRSARRALAALEGGDFTVRLPARAMDDVGFLAVSFNATAEALGNAVRALETEVHERTRAEAALRAGEQRLLEAERDATTMAARMEAVAQEAAHVIAADSPAALARILGTACTRVLAMDSFSFALHDAAEGTLTEVGDDGVTKHAPHPVQGSLDEDVIRTRRSILRSSGRATRSVWGGGGDRGSTWEIRTPVVSSDSVLAVMRVAVTQDEGYRTLDLEVFEALAVLAGSALRNIHLMSELLGSREALSHQAHHDALTGLPNRRRFRERLARAMASHAPERVVVLAVDLDGFKTVNDTLGHGAGDRLLVEVADRLLNATRGADMVARLGGDEFAVLLDHVREDHEAIVVAERIIRAIRAPFSLGERSTVVGTSIGLARGTSAEAHEARSAAGDGTPRDPSDALMRDADLAMYRAKLLGKGRWARFEPSMHEAAAARRALEADLRLAIANAGLVLHYQPIVELRSGRLLGVEALARWQHPERGLVAPADFIPVAEESGLILPLGRWVIREACRQASVWQSTRQRAGHVEPLLVSVNVSSRQLQDPRFEQEVRDALLASGVRPGTLVLELTESAVIDRTEATRERLTALKEAGVLIAIDDFGTGYSALSYLHDIPLDILKIDRAFIEGLARGGAQGALARTILALGDALALRTIAEGVEREEQRLSLLGMGCDLGQGYLFSRPLPPGEIDRLLSLADRDHVAEVA